MDQRLLNKIQGSLIGGAIGDAIGFIIEKKPYDTVVVFCKHLENNEYLIKNRTYPQIYQFGQYSDDTQFSRLLIESHLNNQSFKALLLKNYKTNKLIGLGKGTSNLLKFWNKYPDQEPTFELTNNMSNGSVMRSWTVGLLFDNLQDIVQYSKNQSILTHNHHDAISCSIYIAKIMNYLINLNNQKIDIDSIIKLADHDSLLRKIMIYGRYHLKQPEDLKKYCTTDICPDWNGVPPLAIPTTVAVVLTFINNLDKDFKTTLINGLLCGGDTDTVCSVLGALKGATVGLDQINNQYRNIIHDQNEYKEDYFIDLSNKIYNFKIKNNKG